MVRVASLLNDMPLERANRLFAHPLTQDAYGWVTQFLVELRGCTSYPEYVKFQDGLLARVLEVQGHWEECRRVAHQLGKGKPVPVGAPDLLSGDDANDPESWAVENAVCERVDRHLRSIADAMAWRVFNFDRRAIVALSRNQHPGPMVGRAGLAAEREFVAEWSARDDCFVVLNDLASCLRIGDATLFRSVGQGYEPELRGLPTLAGFRGRAQGLGLTRRFVSARQRWTVGFQTRPYSVGTRAALSRFSYPSGHWRAARAACSACCTWPGDMQMPVSVTDYARIAAPKLTITRSALRVRNSSASAGRLVRSAETRNFAWSTPRGRENDQDGPGRPGSIGTFASAAATGRSVSWPWTASYPTLAAHVEHRLQSRPGRHEARRAERGERIQSVPVRRPADRYRRSCPGRATGRCRIRRPRWQL